jgi:hypothetical protein
MGGEWQVDTVERQSLQAEMNKQADQNASQMLTTMEWQAFDTMDQQQTEANKQAVVKTWNPYEQSRQGINQYAAQQMLNQAQQGLGDCAQGLGRAAFQNPLGVSLSDADELTSLRHQVSVLNVQLASAQSTTNHWRGYAEQLKGRLTAEQPTDIDYHGPVKDGKAIDDAPHEQFHRAVGDVIAGKIIPAARRQMEDALRQAPKEKAPFPVGGSRDDLRRIGWNP